MRVSAVQYHLHTIRSFDEFAAQVTHYVKTAQEFDAEFVLFPEFFTTQLLSIPLDDGRQATIDDLPNYTEKYTELFVSLAKDTGMYLIGGTHVIRQNGKLYNVAHLFAPDGTVHRQAKLHITPTEVNEWNIAPGDGVHVFETDKATIAILTCYDIEFPEIVRMARAKGQMSSSVRRAPMTGTGFTAYGIAATRGPSKTKCMSSRPARSGRFRRSTLCAPISAKRPSSRPTTSRSHPAACLRPARSTTTWSLRLTSTYRFFAKCGKKDRSRHGATGASTCTRIGIK
ncbi:Formamidase [Geobacillus sp. BCO2]|nr:Formamidase [Geobacillus sp. BCO2]